jgi:hypothetical protein
MLSRLNVAGSSYRRRNSLRLPCAAGANAAGNAEIIVERRKPAAGISVAGDSTTTQTMSFLKRNADDGFERLQVMLLAMRAGDAVRIGEAAAVSGLSEDICRTALEALAQIGLMTYERDGRFVRRTLAVVPS